GALAGIPLVRIVTINVDAVAASSVLAPHWTLSPHFVIAIWIYHGDNPDFSIVDPLGHLIRRTVLGKERLHNIHGNLRRHDLASVVHGVEENAWLISFIFLHPVGNFQRPDLTTFMALTNALQTCDVAIGGGKCLE